MCSLSIPLVRAFPQVNRSHALLKSLSAERDRWEQTSETFKNQMSTIAGDCLLSAAFIAYAGYFEQQMRQNLFTTWSHHLQQANIQVTESSITWAGSSPLPASKVLGSIPDVDSLHVEVLTLYLLLGNTFLFNYILLV